MKKRVKLLTTIASLCLAVALMAFGVYAATQSTVVVGSTITFSSSEIKGNWEYSITATTLQVSNGTGKVLYEGEPNTQSGEQLATKDESTANDPNDYKNTISNVAITLATGTDTVVYKVKFTNTGSKAAQVTFNWSWGSGDSGETDVQNAGFDTGKKEGTAFTAKIGETSYTAGTAYTGTASAGIATSDTVELVISIPYSYADMTEANKIAGISAASFLSVTAVATPFTSSGN